MFMRKKSMRKKSMHEKLVLAAVLAFGVCVVNAADAPRLGQPIASADLMPWDISIAPDGVGLPPGSGTPAQGAAVYAERGCALCQGEKGGGGPGGALVGGGPLNSTDRDPAKLIGNYWPYSNMPACSLRPARARNEAPPPIGGLPGGSAVRRLPGWACRTRTTIPAFILGPLRRA
jgi:hypothetical protein